MSKKTMKRSLALGALMAFVITGSAMAAELKNNIGGIESAPIIGEGTNCHGIVSNLTVMKTFNSDTFAGNSFKVTGTGENYGAIYSTSDLAINGCKFEANTLTGGRAHGAAIAHSVGTLTISGSEFIKNVITGASRNYGTAIFSSNASLVDISNSKFENNEGGKAVYFTGNTGVSINVNITDSRFYGNTYGAVQVDTSSTVVNFVGLNKFESNGLETIMNKGTINFIKGSTTIFSDNELDIMFKPNGMTPIMNIEQDSVVIIGSGMQGDGITNINGGTIEFGANSEINKLGGTGGDIVIGVTKDNKIAKVTINEQLDDSGKMNVSGNADVSDYLAANGKAAEEEFTTNDVIDIDEDGVVTTNEGLTGGAYTFTKNANGEWVAEQGVNTKSDAVSDAGMTLKGHWRAHMNDMNKRMGELRNANGEHGVWTRMVRGESEYQGAKMQYNQYQMGYDEKLSVDKRWTVGAAVTFSEGDASYGSGSTDDKSTAFAIYGSKLNNDGTFVDLIARYAKLESDLDDRNYGIGDYSANGMSVSAEFGKRLQHGNGLWIEPQVELTYGSVDSADVTLKNETQTFKAHYDSMDSFIARVGFAMGKDIKQGNVYARASYLYDFDGETATQFEGGKAISEDFGGGWWEVGVGANINLSKATYIYADVEKTFGGEVDTNWQWNLGVRYSF